MRLTFPPYSSTALVPKLYLGTEMVAKLSLAGKGVPKLDGLLPESVYGVVYFIAKIIIYPGKHQ